MYLGGADVLVERGIDCFADEFAFLLEAEVLEEHGNRQNLRQRIGYVQTLTLRPAAVDGFEDWSGASRRSAGQQAHGACDARPLVGQNVAECVFRHDDIEEARVLNHAHGSVIHIHEVCLHIGIFAHHLLRHLAPQAARSQHVGLIDHGQVLSALTGILITYAEDAFHLGPTVVVCVESIFYAIGSHSRFLLLSEVHAAGQLADADKVGTTDKLVLQGGLMDKAVEGFHRSYVSIESKLFAHSQQALFGAHLGRRIVVELRVAHACKEHSISRLAHLEGLFGEGVAHLVDGMGAAKGFRISHLVAELLGYCTEHGHALLHNLGADTVTGQNCDVEFHVCLFTTK